MSPAAVTRLGPYEKLRRDRSAPFRAALGLAGSMFMLIVVLIAFGFGRGLFDCNTMPLLRSVTDPAAAPLPMAFSISRRASPAALPQPAQIE